MYKHLYQHLTDHHTADRTDGSGAELDQSLVHELCPCWAANLEYDPDHHRTRSPRLQWVVETWKLPRASLLSRLT